MLQGNVANSEMFQNVNTFIGGGKISHPDHRGWRSGMESRSEIQKE